MVPLVCAYAITLDKIKLKDTIFGLSLLSLGFSLSVQGIVSALVLFLFAFLEIRGKNFLSVLSFVSIFLLTIYLFISPYLDYRFGFTFGVANDTGVDFRLRTISDIIIFFQTQYPLWPYLGPGILSRTGIPSDISMFLSTVFTFGILPCILFSFFTFIVFFNTTSEFARFKNSSSLPIRPWLSIALLLLFLTKFSLFSVSGILILSLLILSVSESSQQIANV